jgi:hypothetical protein
MAHRPLGDRSGGGIERIREVSSASERGNLSKLDLMAEPAQRQSPPAEAPPLDPTAVQRAYRFYRAQRYAKVEHLRETRMAHARFWAFLGLLLLACLVVAVTVWGEVTKLFGL